MHSNTVYASFTPAEHANFVAAKVVAYATAYLDGRDDAANLGRNARSVMCELIAAPDDGPGRAILWAARMLAQAMSIAAAAEGIARQDRCQHLMGSLVELVRFECGDLRKTGSARA